MSNLSAPVASATSGFPTLNTMPDVIDALKRLERVGSENSKTTEKLINAATELSKKVIEQFRVSGNEAVTVLDHRNSWELDPDDETPRNTYEPEMYYFIEQGRIKNGRTNMFVDQGRDSALAFSKDVAAGLLDHIVDELTTREAETRGGLTVLEAAADKIRAEQEAVKKAEEEALRKGRPRIG